MKIFETVGGVVRKSLRGTTTYSRGNLTLLEQRFIAFVASEGDARSERAVLRRLLAKGRRMTARATLNVGTEI